MAKKFVSSRAVPGLEIIAGKFQFIDGVFQTSDEEATKLEPILTKFYGCTVEDVAVDDTEYADGVARMPDGLLASQTLAASRVGAGAPVEAMVKHGEEAGNPADTGTLSGMGRVVGPDHSLDTAPGEADPKIVSNQSVEAEATNQANTGGIGAGAITGVPGDVGSLNASSVIDDGEGDEEE